MNYRIAIFDLSTDLVDKLNQIYLKLSVMSTVNTFILTDFVYSLEITMAQFSHKVFNSFIFNVHNMLYKRCFFPHINIILQLHFFSSILPQLPPSHATQLGYTAVITGLPFSFFSVTLSFLQDLCLLDLLIHFVGAHHLVTFQEIYLLSILFKYFS